jgi:ABC-type multidrug transport system fused ATPase/permease subunit
MWTSLTFYKEVLIRTPIWVWLVLLSLLILGARQLKDREVRPWTVLIAPLVFMLIGLMGTGRSGLGFFVWAAAVFAAVVIAKQLLRVPRGAFFNANTQRLHLPGEIAAGAWMLITFFVTYFITVLFAVDRALAQSAAAITAASTVQGLLTGTFLARAIKQFMLSRTAHAPVHAPPTRPQI